MHSGLTAHLGGRPVSLHLGLPGGEGTVGQKAAAWDGNWRAGEREQVCFTFTRTWEEPTFSPGPSPPVPGAGDQVRGSPVPSTSSAPEEVGALRPCQWWLTSCQSSERAPSHNPPPPGEWQVINGDSLKVEAAGNAECSVQSPLRGRAVAEIHRGGPRFRKDGL